MNHLKTSDLPPPVEMPIRPEDFESRATQMEEAVLSKEREEGFANQNDLQNFLYEQFQACFPEYVDKSNDFYSAISWGDNRLCILNVCDIASIVRHSEHESLTFEGYSREGFRLGLKQFIKTA